MIDAMREQGVTMVRISHCDLHGGCRSKELPLEDLTLAADGLGYCRVSLMEDVNGNPLDLTGFAAGSPFGDVQTVADLATGRILPWEPDTAWFLSDVRDGLSARGALRRTCATLEAAGLTAIVAPELEFYLLRRLADGRLERYASENQIAYAAGRRADPDGVARRIHRAMDRLGIDVSAAHREFAAGQFEINLRHGPALEAADRAFVLKEAVRELAVAEGLEASFMAKPFADAEGCSLHLHVSLRRGVHNLFEMGTDARSLPAEALSFVAGVIEHAAAITAVGAPTANSYSRLAAGGLVPADADWAFDNRFAYLRVPPERGAATRLEIRVADATANPYLLVAAVLAAGLDGQQRGLTAPPPRAADGPPGRRPLPRTLADAVDCLQDDSVVTCALGPELVRVFCALKRDEADRRARAVTDWDWREYARNA